MNPIEPNTKIRILSPEHSEYVQKLAFEAGFGWNGDQIIYLTNKPYLLFHSNMEISWTCRPDYFDKNTKKEIFIDLPQEPTTYATTISADEYVIEGQKHDTGKHNHYFKDVSDLNEIDDYRVCDLFEVNDASGAIQHALKKLLCSGQRGVKGYRKDLEEARDSIQRKLDILAEDEE